MATQLSRWSSQSRGKTLTFIFYKSLELEIVVSSLLTPPDNITC